MKKTYAILCEVCDKWWYLQFEKPPRWWWRSFPCPRCGMRSGRSRGEVTFVKKDQSITR